jgi:leucine-rich repeat protein SHOC2
LDHRGNELTSVLKGLGKLTALTVLDHYGNLLTSVPAELGDLTALMGCLLNLCCNRLASVPAESGGLTTLTRLQTLVS